MTDPTNNDGPASGLDRAFAVMLGELEDTETELTNRQADLARQLADVDAELDRIARVKSAMLGRPTKGVPAAAGAPGARRPRDVGTPARNKRAPGAEAKARRVLEWARGRDGGFVQREAAGMLDSDVKGVASLLVGMVRRGELVRTGRPGDYRYNVPA